MRLAAVGVSMDDDGWKSVQPYVRAKGVNYAIVIGDAELAGLYGVVGMPVTVLIDREGRIAASHAGVVSKDTYQSENRSAGAREVVGGVRRVG